MLARTVSTLNGCLARDQIDSERSQTWLDLGVYRGVYGNAIHPYKYQDSSDCDTTLPRRGTAQGDADDCGAEPTNVALAWADVRSSLPYVND